MVRAPYRRWLKAVWTTAQQLQHMASEPELEPELQPEPEPETTSEAGATTPTAAAAAEPSPIAVLLPSERQFAPTLAAIAAARDGGKHGEADRLTIEMLTMHDLVKSTLRPPVPAGALPAGLAVSQTELQLDISRFRKWLRTAEGQPWSKIGKGPSDDGLYTVSELLRTHMPRGLSWFEISENQQGTAATAASLAIHGFRKFTGLVASDEDEESGAAENNGLFMYGGRSAADAARLVVTTKSNGENGKWAIRRSPSGEHSLCFAGSKHSTCVWSADVDPRPLYPRSEVYVPAYAIVHAMHGFLAAMDTVTREALIDIVAENCWTLMLEYNSQLCEHIFPIDSDFVEFVAVLDQAGDPISQAQAFTFFDRFGLPRVDCVSHPIAELEDVVRRVRCQTDNEGAVIYLEDSCDKCIGLVKVKTDYYVIARRTRQTFWGGLVDPLLGGKLSDAPAPNRKGKENHGTGLTEALLETQRRLHNGMRTLTHVQGCEAKWKEWFERANLFVNDWHMRYEALSTSEAQHDFALASKRKFGTLYARFCARVDSAGYMAAQSELRRTQVVLHGHRCWLEHVEVLQDLRRHKQAIAGLRQAIPTTGGNPRKEEAMMAKVAVCEEELRALEAKDRDLEASMGAAWLEHNRAAVALQALQEQPSE